SQTVGQRSRAGLTADGAEVNQAIGVDGGQREVRGLRTTLPRGMRYQLLSCGPERRAPRQRQQEEDERSPQHGAPVRREALLLHGTPFQLRSYPSGGVPVQYPLARGVLDVDLTGLLFHRRRVRGVPWRHQE